MLIRVRKKNPAEENIFRQLRLNQWVKTIYQMDALDRWDECDFEVDQDSLLEENVMPDLTFPVLRTLQRLF